MASPPETRCGTIVLAGVPNAGKSTLLNALVGTDLAIVSPKPQSTRQPVIGIRTDGQVQLIFVDPPGLLEPRYLLQQAMLDEAVTVVRGADAVLHLHRTEDGEPPPLATLIPAGALAAKPVAVVLTGADRLAPGSRPVVQPPVFLVSAVTGEGIESLVEWCTTQLPVGPFRYDPEELSTQPVRFFAEEFVREAAFALLGEELPYAMAAQVDEFRESSEPVYIRMTVFVERESQKAIVIGAGGRTIRSLGTRARARIEALLGAQVYLDLRVKVLPHWRKSANRLRRLGFRPQP